jgi:hypothetical protein
MRRTEKLDHIRKRRKAEPVKVPPAAYSISEFCAAHRISEMTYHRLRRQGKGPRTMKVLNRTIMPVRCRLPTKVNRWHQSAADASHQGEHIARRLRHLRGRELDS